METPSMSSLAEILCNKIVAEGFLNRKWDIRSEKLEVGSEKLEMLNPRYVILSENFYGVKFESKNLVFLLHNKINLLHLKHHEQYLRDFLMKISGFFDSKIPAEFFRSE